jgi:DNA-directed RNA polymerase subunit delta
MSDNLVAERIRETSMVDHAYILLKQKGEPMQYTDLMRQISEIKGFTQAEVDRYISQLYTDINIDGRFVCVGRGLWGLKQWYPTEMSTDSAITAHLKDSLDDDEEIFDDVDGIDLDEEELDPDLDEFVDGNFDDDFVEDLDQVDDDDDL